MRPKGSTRAKKLITNEEFFKLLYLLQKNKKVKKATKTKLKRAFTLLYVTGCRISEIAYLKKSDLLEMIEHNEYSLTNQTKTNHPRLISFSKNGEQIEMLKELLFDEDTYLFCKNNSNKPMSKESLKRLCNNFLHVSLGKLYSTHSFRKGYLTSLHTNGKSLEYMRQDIGHTSLVTTALYIEITPEEIAKGKDTIKWR